MWCKGPFPRGKQSLPLYWLESQNISFLFDESCRKSDQCRGNLVSPETFLRTPFSLFWRVDYFKLSGLYVSHTTSNLSVPCRWFWRWGMRSFSAYSLNVVIPAIDKQCTITAPSNTLQLNVSGGRKGISFVQTFYPPNKVCQILTIREEKIELRGKRALPNPLHGSALRNTSDQKETHCFQGL